MRLLQSVCTVFPNIWAVILPLWSYVLPIKPKEPLLLFLTGQVFREVVLCVCLVGTCQGVLLLCCVKSRVAGILGSCSIILHAT